MCKKAFLKKNERLLVSWPPSPPQKKHVCALKNISPQNKQKKKTMPLAGTDAASRMEAHVRWAERYSRYGDVHRARAHFGRALDYDRLVAEGRGTEFGVRLETYDEMISKYASFHVMVPTAPDAGSSFEGNEGERAEYDRLIRIPGASIHSPSLVIRAGDLALAMGDLSLLRYSNQRPDEGQFKACDGSIPGGSAETRTSYKGEIDGLGLEMDIYQRGRPTMYVLASVSAYVHRDRSTHTVHMVIVNNGAKSPENFKALLESVLGDAYSRIDGDVTALYEAAKLKPNGASDTRLAIVTAMKDDVKFKSTEWREEKLRVVHATVAFLAKTNVISGGSLVVINKSGYGPGPEKLEEELKNSRYNLRPIGTSLLVSRADELASMRIVNPVGYVDTRRIGANKKPRLA